MKVEEYEKGPVMCAWCGKVRSKKLIVTLGEERAVVCRSHVCYENGTMMNAPTIEAIRRVWQTKVK